MRRVRGILIVACLVVLGTSVSAQDPAISPEKAKDQKIADLEKRIEEQKKQTDAVIEVLSQIPKPAVPTPRESYAKVYKQAHDRGDAGCKDAGGKKVTAVTIDGDGKASITCGF